MARTDVGMHTPESLNTIASALQAIAQRLIRTAEAMKERGVTSLEVRNQAATRGGIAAVRGFGMAAEEALEEWIFDQNVFKDDLGHVEEAAKPRAGRKARKEPELSPSENPMADPRG